MNVEKLAPKTSGSRTIGGLSYYIAVGLKKERDYDEHGQLVMRGPVIYSDGISEVKVTNEALLRFVTDEMRAVENHRSAKVKEPTAHYAISEAPGDNLTDEQFFEMARHHVAALGYAGHQTIMSVHRDTDNAHVHIGIERVHPVTLTVHKAEYDFRTNVATAEHFEEKWNLQRVDRTKVHERWDAKKNAQERAESGAAEGLDREPVESSKSAMLSNTGRGFSFERWLKRPTIQGVSGRETSLAVELKATLGNIPDAKSIEGTCLQFNVRLARTGSGGLVFVDLDDARLAAPVSQVLSKVQSKRLHETLGPSYVWPHGLTQTVIKSGPDAPAKAVDLAARVEAAVPALKRALESGKWSAMHKAAYAIGATIERKGGGFVFLDPLDLRQSVKLTDAGNAFRGIENEKKLGKFQPADPALVAELSAAPAAAAVSDAPRETRETYAAYVNGFVGDIDREHGEKLCADPSPILIAIASTQSVFEKYDIKKEIQKFAVDEDQEARMLAAALKRCNVYSPIATDKRQTEKYGLKQPLALETDAMERLVRMGKRAGDAPAYELPATVGANLGFELSSEQKAATSHLLDPSRRVAFMVGQAGTGKSKILSVAADEWRAQGRNVRGIATASKVAADLTNGANITSKTIALALSEWSRGVNMLTKNDVLVIDEAAMIGSGPWSKILTEAERVGAKVVAVGDQRQFESIDYGGFFQQSLAKIESATLSRVMRQANEEERVASEKFAAGDVAGAIKSYNDRGKITFTETNEDAIAALTADVIDDIEANPDATRIIMAKENATARRLNHAIETYLQRTGRITDVSTFDVAKVDGDDVRISQRDFGVGSRVQFRENAAKRDIQNGNVGTVVAIDRTGEAPILMIKRDHDQKTIAIDVRDYAKLEHGHAVSTMASQGATRGKAFLIGSALDDYHSLYVGFTRHKDELRVYAAKTEFKDLKALIKTASKKNPKTMGTDRELLRPAILDVTRTEHQFARPKTVSEVAAEASAKAQRDRELVAQIDERRDIAARQRAGLSVLDRQARAEVRDVERNAGGVLDFLQRGSKEAQVSDIRVRQAIDAEKLRAEAEAERARLVGVSEMVQDDSAGRFDDLRWTTAPLSGATTFMDATGKAIAKVDKRGTITARTDDGLEFALRYAQLRHGGATIKGTDLERRTQVARAVEYGTVILNRDSKTAELFKKAKQQAAILQHDRSRRIEELAQQKKLDDAADARRAARAQAIHTPGQGLRR